MDSETVACKKCGKEIDPLSVFPGGICLECHAAVWDKVPLDRMPPPDFVGAINGIRKPKRAKR
jgi:hypothetical protein